MAAKVLALFASLFVFWALAEISAPLALAGNLDEEESPEAFLARAYGQRARAMTFGDSSLLDGLYDPASTELIEYEKRRVAYFHDDFEATWRGKLIAYRSEIRVEETAGTGSTFTARLNETLLIAWLPGATELPPWAEEIRQQGSREHALGPGGGSHGEYISGMGTPHEVTLVRSRDGWRISSDYYREVERGDFALSPGTVIGSWAAPEWTGGPIPGRTYPPILPLTGSAETSFHYSAVMGIVLLGVGLVVRCLGSRAMSQRARLGCLWGSQPKRPM